MIEKVIVVSFRLTEKEFEDLNKVAEDRCVGKSTVITDALKQSNIIGV